MTAPSTETLQKSEGPGGPTVRLEPQKTEWDDRAAIRLAAQSELPEEVLVELGARLKWLALGVFSLALLGVGLGQLLPEVSSRVRASMLLLELVFSAVLWALLRTKVRPELKRDAGYLFLMTTCLALAAYRYGGAVLPTGFSVSPSAVLLVLCAALLPAQPRTTLLVSLAFLGAECSVAYAMHGHAGLWVAGASMVPSALAAPWVSQLVFGLRERIEKEREVGAYHLVRSLGHGGMAEVWEARHRMLRRKAAIKLIRPQILLGHGQRSAERMVQLFLREARATSELSSPHTISLFDFGISKDGAFYYVMELLDGIDLQHLVEKHGPQSDERTIHFLAQACLSLAEAHSRSLVHRDIKPANIFACRMGGQADFVKVLDFGLVLDRHPTVEEIEDEANFVGTAAVMAPEMGRYQAEVDHRADLYALGCVGYFLLTGGRVFEAKTRADMLVMHAHQKPTPPSRRAVRPIAPLLEAAIMQCLEKNPAKRPQSAEELREMLLAVPLDRSWTSERADLWWRSFGAAESNPPNSGGMGENDQVSSTSPPSGAPHAENSEHLPSPRPQLRSPFG